MAQPKTNTGALASLSACLLVVLLGLTGAEACATGFDSPYTLTHKSSTKVKGGQRHCFTVGAVKFPKGTTCSSFMLRKVEFDTRQECVGKMKDMTWNGQRRNPSIQRFAGRGVVTKLTGNPLCKHSQALGKPIELCFTLTGACASLDKFCIMPKCRGSVAFFDMALECCPVV